MRRPSHLTVLVLMLGVIGCMARRADVPTPPPAPGPQALKPASELALLMRAIAAHADSVKAALAQGLELPPYPEVARNLMTATPTEGMEIDPITYPTFGRDYLLKLDNLYQVPADERPQAYNAVVQGCANCHTTHCPGPMMRIKKMYVPLGE
jgi:hypothetical protein